ncbi:MAG: HIT domain-containing protein [Alphaproteobacteria bacterium]|nr:HIT domain-containing protein [Alphaproteobacteria bacterium]
MAEFFLHTQLAQDTFFVKDLKLSKLLLMNDARFPWVVLVPRQPDVKDLIDLLPSSQRILLDEINRVSIFMKRYFKAEKLNIASIGNIVPQLHMHIVARTSKDAAWPKPVWGFGEAVHYTDEKEKAIIAALNQAVG